MRFLLKKVSWSECRSIDKKRLKKKLTSSRIWVERESDPSLVLLFCRSCLPIQVLQYLYLGHENEEKERKEMPPSQHKTREWRRESEWKRGTNRRSSSSSRSEDKKSLTQEKVKKQVRNECAGEGGGEGTSNTYRQTVIPQAAVQDKADWLTVSVSQVVT